MRRKQSKFGFNKMMLRAEVVAAGVAFPTIPVSFNRPSIRLHCFSPGFSHRNYGSKKWDRFYKLHNHKFFKDRHYLEKDWGSYFSQENDDDGLLNAKVVLEVGCGAGNTLFPLMAAFPNLFIHACDFSPEAVSLVKSHKDFTEDRINVFVSDATKDDLSEKIMPSSVDVLTLVFVLSAVSPEKMQIILKNVKKVLKPKACVLLRDYADGDFAQAKLESKNQAIGENFYVRGDGTYSYFFTQDMMLNLFKDSGFRNVDIDVYCKKIENRSRGVTMERRWIRAVFRNVDSVQQVDRNKQPIQLTHLM